MNIYRHTTITALLLTVFLLLLPLPVLAEQRTVNVTGVGFVVQGDAAAARDMAIRDAQTRAVEEALGVEVDAQAALHKSLLIDDTVLTKTQGIVRNYTILSEGLDKQGMYMVTMDAVVDNNIMTDELKRLAGRKKVLLVQAAQKEKGDNPLSAQLAEAFSLAGFSLSRKNLPEEELSLLDVAAIKRLAGKTGNDLVLVHRVSTSLPQCPTRNFCAGEASGFARLYSGKEGKVLGESRQDAVRGFGNTEDVARQDALARCAGLLVPDLFDRLIHQQEKEVRLVFQHVPDYDAFKTLKRIMQNFRWMREVSEDAVGYHPVKSVINARFAQDLDILAGMLGKLGSCRLKGRTGNEFTLEYIGGKGE